MIMEELIQKIDELINAINNNSVPLWLTIIGILVPIAISLLVWWQSHQQNKKNIALQKQITTSEEKLQKEICSKEIKVQRKKNPLANQGVFSFNRFLNNLFFFFLSFCNFFFQPA